MASSTDFHCDSIAIAASLAPPCKGPRKAPTAAVTQEYISDNVEATTRPVNVEALNSCSAYRISETSITRACKSLGFLP